MGTFLLRRLLLLVPVLWGVSTLVFLMLHLVPGDPVVMMLGESAEAADISAMRAQLGLDRPMWEQYGSFMGGLLRGDLGRSLLRDRAVSLILLEKLPATLQLTFAALAVALCIALPVGMFSARHKGSWADAGITVFTYLGISIPNFWLGPMLIIVFSLELKLLPPFGNTAPGSIILPALTLGTALSAFLTRMTRSSLLEVLGEQYVRTARAKGLSPAVVYYKHALRNALIPTITLVGLQLGALLGGSVITETVFNWPGIGREFFNAITRRDYPVVQGCVLFIAVGYTVANVLTDVCYGLVDPRIRLGGGR